MNVARIDTIGGSNRRDRHDVKDQFSDFAALASGAVASIADIQEVLLDDEALLMFLDTDGRFKPIREETFVWVVIKRRASCARTWALRRSPARWPRCAAVSS